MRNKLILSSILTIFLSLLIFTAKPVRSQTTEVSDEYRNVFTEYQKVYAEYSKSREDYVLRRSQYLSYKTLKAQTDAYDATLKLLKDRDEVYLSYMRLMSVKLKETAGIPEGRKEGLQARLDQETTWYTNHKDSLPSAGSLDDLVSDSDEANAHTEISHPLYYETLIYVADGQVSDFNNRTKAFLDEIKKLVDRIKADESEDAFDNEKISLIDRWLFDSESRIARSEDKQTDALKLLSEFLEKRGASQLEKKFNEIIGILGESSLLLKESDAFMGEVISEIKRAD